MLTRATADTTSGESDVPDPLPPGSTLGRFVIVRRLGVGGMGMVYEATHSQLRKRVAIKTLRPDMAKRQDVLARFVREGEAASRLHHPNVVDVSDVGVEAGVPFLVMEFLEGEDLSGLLAREGPLPPHRVAHLMLPVIAAVLAAHEDGIVHRDLKPGNIFLARNRLGTIVPKLLDFGISKVEDSTAGVHATRTSMMLGTASYMAPEQAMGARYAGPASDQYALGVILYECALKRRPFEDEEGDESLYRLLHAIVQGNYPAPESLRPDLPPAFTGLIVRAMARDPVDRFDTVAALGQALLPFADDAVRAQWTDAFGAPAQGAIDATLPQAFGRSLQAGPAAPVRPASRAPGTSPNAQPPGATLDAWSPVAADASQRAPAAHVMTPSHAPIPLTTLAEGVRSMDAPIRSGTRLGSIARTASAAVVAAMIALAGWRLTRPSNDARAPVVPAVPAMSPPSATPVARPVVAPSPQSEPAIEFVSLASADAGAPRSLANRPQRAPAAHPRSGGRVQHTQPTRTPTRVVD